MKTKKNIVSPNHTIIILSLAEKYALRLSPKTLRDFSKTLRVF